MTTMGKRTTGSVAWSSVGKTLHPRSLSLWALVVFVICSISVAYAEEHTPLNSTPEGFLQPPSTRGSDVSNETVSSLPSNDDQAAAEERFNKVMSSDEFQELMSEFAVLLYNPEPFEKLKGLILESIAETDYQPQANLSARAVTTKMVELMNKKAVEDPKFTQRRMELKVITEYLVKLTERAYKQLIDAVTLQDVLNAMKDLEVQEGTSPDAVASLSSNINSAAAQERFTKVKSSKEFQQFIEQLSLSLIVKAHYFNIPEPLEKLKGFILASVGETDYQPQVNLSARAVTTKMVELLQEKAVEDPKFKQLTEAMEVVSHDLAELTKRLYNQTINTITLQDVLTAMKDLEVEEDKSAAAKEGDSEGGDR